MQSELPVAKAVSLEEHDLGRTAKGTGGGDHGAVRTPGKGVTEAVHRLVVVAATRGVELELAGPHPRRHAVGGSVGGGHHQVLAVPAPREAGGRVPVAGVAALLCNHLQLGGAQLERVFPREKRHQLLVGAPRHSTHALRTTGPNAAVRTHGSAWRGSGRDRGAERRGAHPVHCGDVRRFASGRLHLHRRSVGGEANDCVCFDHILGGDPA